MVLTSDLSIVAPAAHEPTRQLRRANRLLSALPAVEVQALSADLRLVSLDQGDILFEPDQAITHVHFPLSGAVSLVRLLRDGANVETLMVGREGMTDAGSYLRPRRSSVRAVVQLPGEALVIPAKRLREAAAAFPGVRETMEGYAADLLDELQRTVACNATHRIEPRLATWLLRSHDRSAGDALPLTQEFLSEMLGVQRTTVNAVASALQRSGAIAYRRGRITILDRAVLRRACCECYSAELGSAATTCEPQRSTAAVDRNSLVCA